LSVNHQVCLTEQPGCMQECAAMLGMYGDIRY